MGIPALEIETWGDPFAFFRRIATKAKGLRFHSTVRSTPIAQVKTDGYPSSRNRDLGRSLRFFPTHRDQSERTALSLDRSFNTDRTGKNRWVSQLSKSRPGEIPSLFSDASRPKRKDCAFTRPFVQHR